MAIAIFWVRVLTEGAGINEATNTFNWVIDKSYFGVSCQGQCEVPFAVRIWDGVRVIVGL